MKCKFIFLLLMFVYIPKAYAANSLNQRQALVNGNFLIFEFTKDYYSVFKPGEKVIIGHKNDSTHTKIIGTLTTKSRPNTTSQIINNNSISLWGALFSLDNDSSGNLCLFRGGVCYAHFKKQLFDAEFTRSLYFNIINGVLIEMSKVRNTVPTYTCGGSDPQFSLNRELGDILFRSAKLLDLIPYVDTHSVYLNGIQQSVSYIQANYTYGAQYKSKYYETAYHSCSGSSEFMTGHLVSRGIFEVYRLSKSNALKVYLSDILTHIVNADQALTVKYMAVNAPNYTYDVFANMHAQLLNVLMLRDELGIETVPAYADGIVKNIMYAQSLNTSRASTSFRYNQDNCQPGGYTLSFGGWAHGIHLSAGTGACNQSMGYHVLTTQPMLAFQRKLNHSSICSTNNFPYSCSQLSWGIRASIAYLMQNSVYEVTSGGTTVKYYGHAEGSVSTTKFNEGNNYGGTSHYVTDYFYNALEDINWISTPGEFNGNRVYKSDLVQNIAKAREYVEISTRDHKSFLVSYAYSKLQ